MLKHPSIVNLIMYYEKYDDVAKVIVILYRKPILI